MFNCERHRRCRVRYYGGGGLIIDFGTAVEMYFMLNISGLVFCSLEPDAATLHSTDHDLRLLLNSLLAFCPR